MSTKPPFIGQAFMEEEPRRYFFAGLVTMRRFDRILLVLVAFVLLAGLAYQHWPQKGKVTLAGHTFNITIANTAKERHQGLTGVKHLPPNQGMWFVMPGGDKVRVFWMKDTPVPLDILFFDSSLHLVSIQPNAKPCFRKSCPFYISVVPASYALEVPAGTVARLNIPLGTKALLQ